MPRISYPVPGQPDVQRATYQGAAPADQSAKFRGTAALAQGIGQAGDVAERFALQTQEFKNRADLARAETSRFEADQALQTQISKEGDETKWGELAAKTSTETKAAIFNQDLAPSVRRELEGSLNDWEKRTQSVVQNQASRRTNDKSKVALETAAETKIRAGMYDEAAADIDAIAAAGGYTPEQHQAAMQRLFDYAGYYSAQQQLIKIGELPPRERAAELEVFTAQLDERDKDGRFKNFEDPKGRGGMSGRGRIEMGSVVASQQRAAVREMDTNTLQLVRGLSSGELTLADVGKAEADGEIPSDLFGPEYDRTVIGRAYEEGKRVTAKRQAVDAAAEQRRVAALEKRVFDDATAGFADIDSQIQKGSINPQDGREMKLRLAATTSVQESLPDYQEISTELDALYSRKLFASGDAAGSARSQPEPRQYKALVAKITDPKSPLTQPARLQLMQRFFEAKMADISELEEEKGDGTWTWIDRDISRPEAAMRVELLKGYGKLLPDLGDAQAGSLMFSQERRIVDFFTQNPKATPEQIGKVRLSLMTEAQALAGQDLLRSVLGN